MCGFWFYDMWRQDYGTYYWLSVQVMVMVFFMLLLAYMESLSYFAELRAANEGKTEETAAPDKA